MRAELDNHHWFRWGGRGGDVGTRKGTGATYQSAKPEGSDTPKKGNANCEHVSGLLYLVQ